MEHASHLSRRQLLRSALGMGAVALLAACGQPTQGNSVAASTSAAGAAPATTAASSAGAASTTGSAAGAATGAASSSSATASAPATASAASGSAASSSAAATSTSVQMSAATVAQVPRNQTLVMSVSDAVNQFSDLGLMNPFVPGVTRNGWQFAYEPLYFYDMWNTQGTCGPQGLACKDGEIPWLATNYAYNQDNTELTITLRDGVTWSDGEPFTANDVVFTLNMLKDNAPKLNFSVEMQQWVKDVSAPDAHTAKITLTSPNPRFMFSYFQWHSDLGFPIVPEHIFKGKDPTTFTNFDLAKGWPVATGPWKLTLESLQQRFWDRRDDWWAAKTGFHALPKMKRVLVLPNFADDKQFELLTNNEVDCTHGFQAAATIPAALARNPKLITWTANKQPPYGALDISTVTTLDFNDSKPPFDDPDIRWAINHTLNRDEIVKVGSHGIGDKVVLPFPPYGQLEPYYNGVGDLLKQYPIDAFDLAKTAQIMQSKGYTKDSQGFWTKDGKRLAIVLTLAQSFFNDIAPVVVAQLRKGGFDASFKSVANAGTLIQQGEVDAFFDIPGGSVRDPYDTLAFLLTKYSAPTGQAAVRPYRWKNAEYDKIVLQMGQTAPSDPSFMGIYHQAMALWIPNLPMIPLIRRYIFITPNTTYWTNWPNEQYPYTLPSGWHRTSGLFINTLEPAT